MQPRPYLMLNGDVPLSARIYRDNDDLTERQPAVIVTGSWLTVKEQMADRYARQLARRGYTWVVHGHYIARLADGKIAALTLQTIRAHGHDGLPTIAARRP